MKKKLIIDNCEDCKDIIKGYRWKSEDDHVSLVVIWTCKKLRRMIYKTKIHADEVIFSDFNKDVFEDKLLGVVIYIPLWCPLPDDTHIPSV